MRCEAFFRIIENIVLYDVNSSCSANAARTNSIESIYISKYPTNRSFQKHSLRSDDRTRKRMTSRHNEIG